MGCNLKGSYDAISCFFISLVRYKFFMHILNMYNCENVFNYVVVYETFYTREKPLTFAFSYAFGRHIQYTIYTVYPYVPWESNL